VLVRRDDITSERRGNSNRPGFIVSCIRYVEIIVSKEGLAGEGFSVLPINTRESAVCQGPVSPERRIPDTVRTLVPVPLAKIWALPYLIEKESAEFWVLSAEFWGLRSTQFIKMSNRGYLRPIDRQTVRLIDLPTLQRDSCPQFLAVVKPDLEYSNSQ
jgi:hypothetical protein